MGVQLGFDGSIRLQTRDAVSIRHVLDRTLERYVGFCADIAHELTPELVYWRTVFAMLSTHTAFEATEAAYLELHNNGMPKDWGELTAVLSLVKAGQWVIQFAGQKAGNILAFDAAWQRDAEQFMPELDHREWRDKLDTLRGLARMKASFAVCLADPMCSDVVCIDRHMARLLVDPSRGETQLRVGEYDAAESRIVRLAREYSAPPFAVQWALWDAVRGHPEPHASLRAA